MSMKTISWVAALLLTVSSSLAYAQLSPAPFYFGAALGQSKAKNFDACADAGTVFDPGYSCSSSDSKTGWKLFAGYQVNEYFAAEIGYVNLGKFSGSASGTVTGTPVSAEVSAEPTGITIDAIGSWPITPEFAVTGRLGFFSWSLDNKASVSGLGSVSEKPTGTNADFGIGVRYDFDRNVSLRAEYQVFKDIGNDTTGKSDVDLINVGVAYHFK